jgi:hypothetical protein
MEVKTGLGRAEQGMLRMPDAREKSAQQAKLLGKQVSSNQQGLGGRSTHSSGGLSQLAPNEAGPVD